MKAAAVVAIAMTWPLAMSASDAFATCFQPLTDINSKNAADWQDLRSHVPSVMGAGVRRFLTIDDAAGGRINRDYYELRFSNPKNTSLKELFRRLRRNFDHYARGQNNAYRFSSYSSAARVLWLSDNPTGAVMTFTVAEHQPALLLRAHAAAGIRFVFENADVQVTCASETDFIFSTVYTEHNTEHPVSGHRGFGIKSNQDGTVSFYSKGIDRETKGATGLPYIGNLLARFSGKDVFELGHEFWLFFYQNMGDDLSSVDMPPVSPLHVNSDRYPFP